MNSLNTLVQALYNRIEFYEKAAYRTKLTDLSLASLFHHLAFESRRFLRALDKMLLSESGLHITERSNRTSFQTLWSDFRESLVGSEPIGLLRAAERMELTTQKTYAQILKADALPGSLRQLVTSQFHLLQSVGQQVHAAVLQHRD